MLYYDEVFLSIQGESTDTGLPCIFIRLFGCPIKCVYCDQPQDLKNRKETSCEDLIKKVKSFEGVKRICITGGEPLIYKDTLVLAEELCKNGYEVSIETSGCIALPKCLVERKFKYIMDIKCPSSLVSFKNIYGNLSRLNENDEVVFVIADRKDYDFMKQVLFKYPTSAHILLSPMFDKNGKAVIGFDLVKWLLTDRLDYRIQIQLHKILGVK